MTNLSEYFVGHLRWPEDTSSEFRPTGLAYFDSMRSKALLYFCLELDSTLWVLQIGVKEENFDLSLQELAKKGGILSFFGDFVHIILLGYQLVLY